MATLDVYYHPAFLRHETGEHPESKQRLIVAVEALQESDLGFQWVTPGPATPEAVAKIHDASYIDIVREVAETGGGWLDGDTAISPDSYQAAMLAAGAGIAGVEKALDAGGPSFMLVRPPGHHARAAKGMGFCLFNNIAIAAAHAVEELGLDRILIVDWDVHHGNGTNEAFYDDPRVLFFSVHESPHYPGTGMATDIGTGEGAGFSMNVPVRAGSGDGVLVAAFESLLLPVATEFQPQLVLISAGFDGQASDPLGDLRYSERSFQWMGARLLALSKDCGAPPPVGFLEGGYLPKMMSNSLVAALGGMSGREPNFEAVVTSSEEADVERAIEALRPYWKGVL
jgi:acetoin utilization deacetylase AcuC-like enzyme